VLVERSAQLRGTRLGGYEIVRLIGHGATASVFEATHVALGRQVAIKVLHEHLAADEQLRKRFVREGRIAARLRHPHTVTVLDVGIESGLPYLVMELLGGSDLRTLLADVHLVSVEHALAFLLPIASALAQAHDAAILHRDLKPANIFLAHDLRGDVVPKLVDFGLSKITTGEATTSLTAAELVAGTVLYMAPEQTLGVKHCSPASDQYSLAAILYECVSGVTPFAADDIYALLERIRTDVARPPSHLNPRIAEDFDDVILRALRRDPSKRFSSVRAFARALLPFAGADTVRAFERDFFDRASAGTAVAPARLGPDESAQVETRFEQQVPLAAALEESSLRETARAMDGSAVAAPPVAPLPCPPGSSPFHIKGMPYRGLVFVVNRLLPGGLAALCEALPDERLRTFARQPFLATARYDILPLLPLYATLARLLDMPFDGFVRTSCAAQCRYDTQTVFKSIWANATVESIADRIGRFSAQYYDFGKVSASVPEPHVLVIEHTGIPAYVHPWFRPMHESYKEELIRHLGGEDVQTVSHEAVADGVRGGMGLVRTRRAGRWREAR
jgi:tRNA A-37 threonylcarbamoyl transferase component Bud32